MTVGTKTIGFTFSILTPSQVTGVPQQQNVVNTFDLVGDIISTKRLNGENNTEYKQRLMDVAVHPGSPLYEGVVNNITREFGYTRQKALIISLQLNSSGEPIAISPRVDFLANKVILYSDWRPDGTAVIDKQVAIYNPSDAGYFLEDLITQINTSTCFTATIESNVRENLHSTNLIRVSSDNFVERDPVDVDRQTRLVGQLITKDSLIFSDLEVFETEVSGSPSQLGEYQVDYINGRIYLYDIPSGNQDVSYHYQTFPLEVDYSLVKVYTLQDDNFTYELYNHEILDSGEEVNALPNTEGSEILHQLYKETNVFWGK